KGPNARLAEIIPVKIPRPRTRAELIDDPEYLRLRNHTLHFLVEAAQRPAAAEVEIAASTGRFPALATRTGEPEEESWTGPPHSRRSEPLAATAASATTISRRRSAPRTRPTWRPRCTDSID